MPSSDFHATLTRLIEEGREFATATVVKVSGSVPRGVGAKMIVMGRGESFDTLGGGSFEAMVIEDALEVIATGKPSLKKYSFSEKGDDSVGQVCGGAVEVFIEPSGQPERLLILGAGHVGQALARHAVGLGYQIVVADDRPEFLRAGLFPPAARLVLTDASYSRDLPPIDRRTSVCVVTRCHKTDRDALLRAVSGDAAYVGLIGSKRKKLILYEDLGKSGVPPESLARVHSPIGLDIGAETPDEIAVAIVAELIRERRGRIGRR